MDPLGHLECVSRYDVTFNSHQTSPGTEVPQGRTYRSLIHRQRRLALPTGTEVPQGRTYRSIASAWSAFTWTPARPPLHCIQAGRAARRAPSSTNSASRRTPAPTPRQITGSSPRTSPACSPPTTCDEARASSCGPSPKGAGRLASVIGI